MLWFAGITACTNNNPLAPVALGLNGHWTFDEGSGAGVSDVSGANGPGILSDEANGWAAPGYGTSGSAFYGTGASFVEIGDPQLSAVFPGKSGGTARSFSILAWIQPTQTAYQMILAKDQADARSFNFSLNLQGQLTLQIYPEGWTAGNPFANFSGDSSLSPNQGWMHVAVVLSYVPGGESTVVSYIGGEVDAQANFTLEAMAATATALRIGARDYGPLIQNNFMGMIDELRVYNRALSQSEIQLILNL